MKVTERLMSDLEEEILFLLSIKQNDLSTLAVAEHVCEKFNTFISQARIHETLMRLSSDGLIYITIVQEKRHYKITASGLAALQTDWDYYRRNLSAS